MPSSFASFSLLAYIVALKTHQVGYTCVCVYAMYRVSQLDCLDENTRNLLTHSEVIAIIKENEMPMWLSDVCRFCVQVFFVRFLQTSPKPLCFKCAFARLPDALWNVKLELDRLDGIQRRHGPVAQQQARLAEPLVVQFDNRHPIHNRQIDFHQGLLSEPRFISQNEVLSVAVPHKQEEFRWGLFICAQSKNTCAYTLESDLHVLLCKVQNHTQRDNRQHDWDMQWSVGAEHSHVYAAFFGNGNTQHRICLRNRIVQRGFQRLEKIW